MRLRRCEPEELLRSGRDVGVGTGRAGKVGERAGDGWRGLQIESGVGPAQHQLVVPQLKIEIHLRSLRLVLFPISYTKEA